MRSYRNIRQFVHRQRKKTMPIEPKKHEDVEIPEEYLQTMSGGRFFRQSIESNGKKILIFASQTQLECLSGSSHLYADGTFHMAPKPFSQLYTIHCQKMSTILPVVFLVLPDKSTQTYSKAFTAVKQICTTNGLGFAPQSIMIDFECAAKQAWSQVFPEIEIQGCMFHFGQSIWRKIQALGLASDYNNHIQFQKWARLIFSLPLIPPSRIDDLWNDHIMAEAPFHVRKLL